MNDTEKYFSKFRKNIIGLDLAFNSPYGKKKIIYADWIASGRLYKPIEDTMLNKVYPYVGNTHSETTLTGTTMTKAYQRAHRIIKEHVNASKDDIIITAGFGMTTVVNKFQRILGLKVCEQIKKYTSIPNEEKPVVFLSHMEHHSNQTSWLETIAEVVVLKPDKNGLVDYEKFPTILEKYKERKIKILSCTAASNVTGVAIDYYRLSAEIHKLNGFIFVDFAAAAPYKNINMHPGNKPNQYLDAIYFSPHKFLGGPGTPGVLVFNSSLYNLQVPDHPGGGTVEWTNPWGGHKYSNDIEIREDGGTPGFLQAIKAAQCIKLKDEMGVDNISIRERELLKLSIEGLRNIPGIHILANNFTERLGVISFYVENVHYNLMVKILNDRFGIQVRGGCSCAGTYGHYLLHVDPTRSKRITDKINQGDLSEKPGWVRMSLHPTMTNEEIIFIISAIEDIIKNIKTWEKDYNYSSHSNEFYHKDSDNNEYSFIENWF